MTTHHFTYTNKQRLIRGGQTFFMLTFLIATGYIILNIQSLWETHPIQIIILFLIICGIVIPFLLNDKGPESKGDIKVSDDALIIIDDAIRIPFQNLQLDSYHSEELNYHCYHLSSSADHFTLYTNQKDDLINHLLNTDIPQRHFSIAEYQFKRSSEVFIETENNSTFYFDLNSGEYSTDGPENRRTPKLFIQTPGYKKA